MKLWLAGKLTIGLHSWDFVGIYSTEELAIAACLDKTFFVAPVELDATAPEEPMPFPESYYPCIAC